MIIGGPAVFLTCTPRMHVTVCDGAMSQIKTKNYGCPNKIMGWVLTTAQTKIGVPFELIYLNPKLSIMLCVCLFKYLKFQFARLVNLFGLLNQ